MTSTHAICMPLRRLAFVLLATIALNAAGAAIDSAPGIAPVPRDARATTQGQFPSDMRVGGFDGVYREGVLFPSSTGGAGRVAVWESKAGVLRTDAYPADEFVFVLAGELETVDRAGAAHRFKPGDTFVIPKGWAGEWRMLSDFKKIFVNF